MRCYPFAPLLTSSFRTSQVSTLDKSPLPAHTTYNHNPFKPLKLTAVFTHPHTGPDTFILQGILDDGAKLKPPWVTQTHSNSDRLRTENLSAWLRPACRRAVAGKLSTHVPQDGCWLSCAGKKNPLELVATQLMFRCTKMSSSAAWQRCLLSISFLPFLVWYSFPVFVCGFSRTDMNSASNNICRNSWILPCLGSLNEVFTVPESNRE